VLSNNSVVQFVCCRPLMSMEVPQRDRKSEVESERRSQTRTKEQVIYHF